MRLQELQELVDRIKHEKEFRVAETSKLMDVTHDELPRNGSHRSFYEEGLRKYWATVLRHLAAKRKALDLTGMPDGR